MDALFIVDDVEARLGRPLTAAETARAGALIADASASIRNYLRQDITAATSTAVRLQVRNGRVRLPQRPVTAVSAVDSINGDPLMYQWYGDDTIVTTGLFPDTFAWEPFRTGTQVVDVTYAHGYTPVPDDIIGVGCSIVMRGFGRDPVDAGITSESIQGYSYSLGSVGAAGALGLLQAEKDILDAYCRVGGSINTSPSFIT